MEISGAIQNHESHGDLTTSQRVARTAAALVMFLYPMTTAASPLGIIALLPLIAIYPMFSAVVGWDPVRYVLEGNKEWGISQTVARAGLVVIGTGLIGAPMLASVNPIGGLSLLALLGILPIFAAIFGENPVTALIESNRGYHDKTQDIDQKQVAEQGRVVEYTRKDSQNSSHQEHLPTHHEAA
jgi:hypothetical protein